MQILHNGNILFDKKYLSLKPPEMERVSLDFSNVALRTSDTIELHLLRR